VTDTGDVRHDAARTVRAGEVDLRFDAFGEPGNPGMVLIMGMGFQLVHWPEGFCRRLAGEGFRVVRFDNRDAGRSTHLPGRRYTLEDMADDTVGLLDALAVDSAHVVGASLGGMIAQVTAIRHPARVRSLASLMSTTGRRGRGRTSPIVLRHLLARPPRTQEQAIERRVRVSPRSGRGASRRTSTSCAGSRHWPWPAIPTPGPVGAASTARCGMRATGPPHWGGWRCRPS
jgi:pimeloyl-ACP methyl ester carboxylesterase